MTQSARDGHLKGRSLTISSARALPFVGEILNIRNNTYTVRSYTPNNGLATAQWLLSSNNHSLTLSFHTLLRYWLMSRRQPATPLAAFDDSLYSHINPDDNPMQNVREPLLDQPLPPLGVFLAPSPRQGGVEATPSPRNEEMGTPSPLGAGDASPVWGDPSLGPWPD